MNTLKEQLVLVLIILVVLISLDKAFRPNKSVSLSEVMEKRVEGKR